MGIFDAISGAFGGGQQAPQQAQALQQLGQQQYTNPMAGVNPLLKLGIGIGGPQAVKSFQQQGLAMQEKQMEADKMNRLRELGEMLQSGDIDEETARARYAGITGDLSGALRPSAAAPSAVREFEYFSNLPQEERDRYLKVKRANTLMDLGATQTMVDPQGKVVTQFEKSIAPEATPEFKAEQARAVEQAKQDVAEQVVIDKKSRDATDVISLAGQADQYLDVASGSGIDALSAVGKRFVGVSDPQTQANAALKVISGKLVSNMPRMEGPQSDKDVQLYKDMAANIADPMVPSQDKRVALQALKELNEKYESGPVLKEEGAPEVSKNPSEMKDLELLKALGL